MVRQLTLSLPLPRRLSGLHGRGDRGRCHVLRVRVHESLLVHSSVGRVVVVARRSGPVRVRVGGTLQRGRRRLLFKSVPGRWVIQKVRGRRRIP